ncbi:hypothetical protein H1230_09125 [Paenibacillus sp. 19GGS1-52]|uniref:hypothetical protein n=1 Tax=Paenibacillus sp. 19GGS1-52 TaxID=2758563 RepID=UPI001EFB6B42|nr:hypothetical protein [Paenibacillus sp. 19GGS1-52]ULO08912.1 hypothetical protein H1230_09125 [Paenibacillus sp. 19GGS1-52]
MPGDSFPFTIYSGLLEPQHYQQIGSALWLFAWCISSTTAEIEDDGIVWGVVLGGMPMKLSVIGEKFGVNDKTVSRWISDLQDHGYIRTTRAPRGLILKVKNSKKNLLKRSDKNVCSPLTDDQTKMSDHKQSETTNMSDHNNGDKTYLSDHEPISPSDQTNMSDAKDIKDLITTTTILENEFSEEFTPNPETDGMIAILNAYCKLHSKIDFNVTALERQAMGKMVAEGMPVPFTIQTMASLYQAKQTREKEDFKQPNGFAYYVPGIKEAWKNSQVISQKTRETVQREPEPPKRMTKRQQELEDLRRRAKEAKQLEESSSH